MAGHDVTDVKRRSALWVEDRTREAEPRALTARLAACEPIGGPIGPIGESFREEAA